MRRTRRRDEEAEEEEEQDDIPVNDYILKLITCLF